MHVVNTVSYEITKRWKTLLLITLMLMKFWQGSQASCAKLLAAFVDFIPKPQLFKHLIIQTLCLGPCVYMHMLIGNLNYPNVFGWFLLVRDNWDCTYSWVPVMGEVFLTSKGNAKDPRLMCSLCYGENNCCWTFVVESITYDNGRLLVSVFHLTACSICSFAGRIDGGLWRYKSW